ncbi:caspase a-like [Takifugu flavidus]|uniref:caspase a-like n=1 Tax=Takifugu flavidus TaxID=433684 RepID=UPI002544C828|nr:caspase a-like [Takifugu flavidus]
MAGQLDSIRLMFVEKVSTQMINQLLDDVFMDGIVSEMEKESITEKSNIRSDKARRLIDLVRKKGERACKKMISHIQSRDPELSAVLGLSCGHPAPPEPQMEGQGSSSSPPSIDVFWKEKQSDKAVYPGTREAINNRVALVITNITFMNQCLNRKGAEKDEENMETLLKGLGYEVVKYRNLTGRAIEDAVIDFSKRPKLKDTDSVVVVIMSHGRLGVVAGVSTQSKTYEDDHFSLDKIYRRLGPEDCPALLNKPKIIIIQACRGGDDPLKIIFNDQHPPENPPVSDDANIQEDAIRIEHKEKDFICLLSCTPDTVSHRSLAKGSFLVQVLVDVFNASAERDDLEELFRKVQHRFEDFPIGNRRQMPTRDRCTLTKRFYFYPGLI